MSHFQVNVPVSATSTVADVQFEVDTSKLTQDVIDYIWRYGIQRVINDRCGGAEKSDEEKHKIARDRVTALHDGTVRSHGGGSRGNLLLPEIRKLVCKQFSIKPSEVSKRIRGGTMAADLLAESVLFATRQVMNKSKCDKEKAARLVAKAGYGETFAKKITASAERIVSVAREEADDEFSIN